MLKPPTPKREKERLETLKEYGVLDSRPEAHFDEITKTAALIFDCQIALISLIDKDRQWFKAKYGLDVTETHRDLSFCGHAILNDEVLVVENTEKDPKFCDNPLCLNEPQIRFYAGAPLIAPNGHRIGTLCVIDPAPKTITTNQRALLKTLANQVMSYLELAKKTKELSSSEAKRENLLNNMLEGMVIQDESGKIIEFNPAASEILGLTADQLAGRTSYDPRWKATRHDGSPLPGDEHPSMITLKTGKRIRNFIMGLDVPEKGLRWVQVNSVPVPAKGGGFNAVSTFQDITDIMRKNAEIESYAKGLDKHAIVVKTDERGMITYINKKCCDVSEYSKEELIGKEHAVLSSQGQNKALLKEISESVYNGEVWRGEIKCASKSGRIFWLDTTVTPLLAPTGKIQEFIIFNYDITAKKIADIEIKSRENKLRQLFNQSHDAIMTLEPPYWSFTSCNPATLKLFGIESEKDLIKLNPAAISPGRQPDGELSSEKAQRMIALAMEKGAHLFEWTHTTTKDKEIQCTVLLSRIQEGEKVYLHAVVRDISLEKHLEKELVESKRYLDLVLEGSGIGIWDWDLSDDTVKYDNRWANLLGYELKELKSDVSTWESKVHPDDLQDVYKSIKAYRNGRTKRFEHINRMKHKNGNWIYVLNRGRFSAWDKNGNPVKFSGTLVDITETKRAQDKKLAELNEVLSSTPSCLKIITKEGLLLEMNPQGLSLIEAPDMESVLHANVYDIVAPEHRQEYKKFNEKICSGEKDTLVFEIIGLKGTRRWMESHAGPYKLPNGEIAHIAITNDITKRVLDKEEMEQQKAMSLQNAKLASIGELAAGVGHEINNPLAIVKGYLLTVKEKIKRDKELPPERLLHYMEKSELATDKIAHIVRGLRTLSRADSENFCCFAPLDAVKESFHLVNEIYAKQGIKIEFLNELKGDMTIAGNQSKLQQIFMNLISNAKDAVSDVPDKKIKLHLKREQNHFAMIVEDNGCGIPPEVQNKVFDPFFTTKDVDKGTGIGLSLTYSFVKEMNGEITVESKENKGSIFTVKIPFVSERNQKVLSSC